VVYDVNIDEFTRFSDKMPEDGTVILAFRLTENDNLESYCRRRFFRDIDIDDTTYPLTHYKIDNE